MHHTHQIDIKHAIPLLNGAGFNPTFRCDTGIINQPVQLGFILLELRKQRLH
mgnify:CR=1 FL=1